MINKKCLKVKKDVKDLNVYLSDYLKDFSDSNEILSRKVKMKVLDKNKMKNNQNYPDVFWLQSGYGRFFMVMIDAEGLKSEITLDFCKPGKMVILKGLSKDFSFELAPGSVILYGNKSLFSAINLSEIESAELKGKTLMSDRSEKLITMNMMRCKPRERYLEFLKLFGKDIEQHFAIKHIAGYLGMRPSYLSRIRGQFVKSKVEVIMYLQAVLFMTMLG